MSRNRHARVSEILARAFELADGDRGRFLDRACAGDATLRSEVESLLSHDRCAAPILDASSTAPRPAPIQEQIGTYRILETLGEGGMGVVYRAEQRGPIRRQVALKRIRAGFESRQVLARFERERQTLAAMNHPNIARVIDAGATDDGLPYFAMEYVPGDPITRYCDRNTLSIDARIALFLDVCEGVQHAHRHGIIHRDLKPSNILVAHIDDRPAPKVIDFGVAKALESEPGAMAPVTAAGQLLGTPEYMSPEQAAGSSAVDTRADVYALGAILYELLVGSRPHASAADPSRPSARLAALGATADDVSRARACTSKQLSARIRGDLDWIVMTAIEHDPDRRYGSVTDLARDLRRHLIHEPVTARPPTFVYRARKLARRHRAAARLVAVLTALGALLAGALAIQTYRASVERGRSERMANFLIGLFRTSSEGVSGRWGTRPPASILADGLDKIEEELDDPLVRGRTYAAVGRTLRIIGSFDHAREATTRARDGLEVLLGPEHRETLAAQTELARVEIWQSRLDDAERLLLGTLAAQRQTLGDRHPDTVDTLLELAQTLKLARRNQESARLFEEAVNTLTEARGERAPLALIAKSLLASVYLDLRRLDEAETLLIGIVGDDRLRSNERGMALYNLACVRALRGDRDEALARLREAIYDGRFVIGFIADPNMAPLIDDSEFNELARRTRAMGSHFREVSRARALLLASEGRHAEAEKLLRALIRDADPGLPNDQGPETWYLARLYLDQGRYEEAERLLARERSFRRSTTTWMSYLALARFGKGDREAGLSTIDQAIRTNLAGDTMPDPEQSFLEAIRASARGDAAAALQHLAEAYARGFWDASRLEIGRPFARLSRNPEYERIRRGMEERSRYP